MMWALEALRGCVVSNVVRDEPACLLATQLTKKIAITVAALLESSAVEELATLTGRSNYGVQMVSSGMLTVRDQIGATMFYFSSRKLHAHPALISLTVKATPTTGHSPAPATPSLSAAETRRRRVGPPSGWRQR